VVATLKSIDYNVAMTLVKTACVHMLMSGLSFALQLLGGDSFGDPTELLPYLGPGGGSSSTAAPDALMTDGKTSTGHSDDILALFS